MVGDNGEPMPEIWQVEPRPSPFDVKPGPDAPVTALAIADTDIDELDGLADN